MLRLFHPPYGVAATMHADHVLSLKTPIECERFAAEARKRNQHDIADQAIAREKELRIAYVAKIKDIRGCKNLMENVVKNQKPYLVEHIQRRIVELKYEAAPVDDPFQQDVLKSLYAYEQVIGRPAARTRPMLRKGALVDTVTKMLSKTAISPGFNRLQQNGLQDLTLEAVVCRHERRFDPAIVALCHHRLG